MQENELTLNGQTLFYRSIGSGPDVLLVHGFGEDGSIWDRQFEALKGFRLIVPDLPGSGRSQLVPDMSMEGLASVLYRLLKHLNIGRIAVIGHSMGGYVALAFAEKFPELLSGLGLFHSTAYADTEEKKSNSKKRHRLYTKKWRSGISGNLHTQFVQSHDQGTES